jgi:plastocyanin
MLTPYAAHAATESISITGTAFNPQNVTVAAGDAVSFVNNTSTGHTIVSDNGTFTTGVIPAGGNATAVFTLPGTYAFHDVVTTSMSGTITVLGVAPVPSSGGTYVNPNANFNQSVGTQAYTGGNSGSTAALYAQVQSLINQINALQGTAGTGGTNYSTTAGATAATNSSSCPLIGRALTIGATGDDVTRLQQFLARDPSIYPQGTVSGFYGALTQAAVQHWQVKYNIVSSGSPSTTGYGVVGPRTAAAIALLCTTGSYGGVSGPGGGTTSPVGGFIQVTPVSGAAPLVVNVTATVNTTLSCAGAQYVLDFGDGSAAQQIPVSAGNCSQLSQTYPHTYNYGGTYAITLSAGGHTTSATVTLTGPAAPATGTGTTPNPGQFTGTISAFTTSGNAPLNVTFYVSCAAGTAYNVVFGDGQDLGSTGVSGSKCGSGGLDAVSHTYNALGSFTAQLIIFAQESNGTVTPHNVGSVGISVGSVATNYAYNPPSLSQGTSALSFSLQFDLPTACTGYDINWGDGSSHNSQGDGGSACTQSTTIKTSSHTYANAGAYHIVLERGATLAKTDDVAVTIAQ